MNIFFLVLFTCLSILAYYFRYIKKEPDHYGGGAAAVLMFPVLSFGMAFAVYMELTATSELAKHITPYNGDMSSKYMPLAYIWSFESTDSKEKVEAFYSDEKNHEDWVVLRGFPFMTLQKGNKIMRITVNVNFMKKTDIDYSLSNAKKKDEEPLEEMNKTQELIKNPEPITEWFENKIKYIEALPKD